MALWWLVALGLVYGLAALAAWRVWAYVRSDHPTRDPTRRVAVWFLSQAVLLAPLTAPLLLVVWWAERRDHQRRRTRTAPRRRGHPRSRARHASGVDRE